MDENLKLDNENIISEEENGQIQNTETLAENNDDWEKRYKDTQSAFTKANQEKIELARALVEANPKSIETIKDEKVRNRILQDKYGVDNIEEFKILYPDLFSSENENNKEVDNSEVFELKKEIELIKYREKRERNNIILENALRENNISQSDIKDVVKEELKYISENLPEEERVKRAIKIVTGNNNNSAKVYGLIQGNSGASSQETSSGTTGKDGKIFKEIMRVLRY